MNPTNIKRPFHITVQPRYTLMRCDKLKDENARGLFGFHPGNCPDCKRTLDGFDLHGENGHMQGFFRQQERPSDEDLKQWAARCNFMTRTTFSHSEHGFTYQGN